MADSFIQWLVIHSQGKCRIFLKLLIYANFCNFTMRQSQCRLTPSVVLCACVCVLSSFFFLPDVAEAGQCVYRHLDNFSRKHQAPSTTSVSSSHSRSSREMSKLELLDPLDQFLMLRKAPAAAARSKGPGSVTTTVEGQANPVGGVGSSSSSSLVAVVQPRVNTGWPETVYSCIGLKIFCRVLMLGRKKLVPV